MKVKTLLLVILVAVLAAAGGWFAAKHSPSSAGTPAASGRKVLFYQSPMHPWIKSDKPGKCTICGMDLAPVYEGDKVLGMQEGTVALGSNSINVLNVQTVEVKKEPLRRTLQVAGTIEDNDMRHRLLSAYVEGRVDKLFVNYVGAEVVQGQPLATLYSTGLLNAEREYIGLAKRTAGRESTELQKVNQDLLAASAQRLKQLGLTEEQIKGLPAKPEGSLHTEILAPVSGTVVSRNIYEGQYVKEGEKLFEIADFSTMWFQFDAYERDLNWLRIGQKVSITTPALPGKSFDGNIAFIDPNIKEMTRSAKVRVEIPNPLIDVAGRKQRELLHKLYAQGTVQVETPEVVTVPRTAVLAPGAQAVVYVDKQGGAYEQRRVKLGRSGDDSWEILDGLKEGERVVTTGNLLIDAQAQLNASANMGDDAYAATPGVQPVAASGKAAALAESQRKALNALFSQTDKIGQALASDNFQEFKTQSPALQEMVATSKKELQPVASWEPLMDKVGSAVQFPEVTDLAGARKVFLPFSMAVADLAQRARKEDKAFRSVKVYQCPMVNQAVPGAPKRGLWVQSSPPLRNPFFGSEMIDCGSEVK
ncbi:MAG: hypothetical protein JWM16_4102 [Verrucomicrobiales bacterium]|nr:hypothetical protein [Verrucomicrobiales bacterium]